jgi:succinyl-CoA synthetase alpha subunit
LSILIDKNTKVIVQGITGRDGSFHTKQMLDYGTKIVGGVTPGKGGTEVFGVPVFDTVAEAVEKTKANTSVIYVPSKFAVDAILEAANAGIKLVVCISEGIAALDMLKVYHYLKGTGTRLVGPNSPGLIAPGVTKVGIMPGQIHKKGNVGVVSRSGTLTYEVVYHLTLNEIGQSTCIGIGGDPIIGTNFIDCLTMFENDLQTKAVVLIGEIGGTDEEEAAEFIRKNMTKPVVAFIAGKTAPPGKRMGHAGAIIAGGSGTAAEKVAAFEKAGIKVAETPSEVAELVKKVLGKKKGKIEKGKRKIEKKIKKTKLEKTKVERRKVKKLTGKKQIGKKQKSKRKARKR